jgi:hypothetical protein
LKAWNLPDIIWKSVEFQSYPEFSLPDNLPEDIRGVSAIFYFAHLCYDFFRGCPIEELPITFIDDYSPLMNWEGLSINNIAENKLLPALSGKSKNLPTPLRQLLKIHLK